MKPYYQDELVSLYNGDSYELCLLFPKPDLLLIDPPYELETATVVNFSQQTRHYQGEFKDFTDKGFNEAILDNFDNWISFCSLAQVPKLINKAQLRYWMLLTWHKTNPIPLCRNSYVPDTEYIVHSWSKGRLFGKYADKARYITYPTSQNKPHPNQKPLAVIKRLVGLGSQEGDTVMDIFAGSGTTGMACKEMGRKCILIEREERYCEIAAKALSQGLLGV